MGSLSKHPVILFAQFTVKVDRAGQTWNSLDDVPSDGKHSYTAMLDFNSATAIECLLIAIGRKTWNKSNKLNSSTNLVFDNVSIVMCPEVNMQNMIQGDQIRLPRGSQKPIGASTPNSSSKDIYIDKECYSKLERCHKCSAWQRSSPSWLIEHCARWGRTQMRSLRKRESQGHGTFLKLIM